ncbi:hypothetical protein DCAR_0416659 [Daucus carota subsp. sativus]|uniref:Auxin response factor n=1 Tax=Daucus carota subsp. sativus TaxID=79200 RepID=A0A162ABF0_DAUCS|nr:PREDICTED: auxin response factor 17-like [Daucus carota subsp. sativus]WOG97319.1 hypothetical protein DCAR_0416659 [Daucus carota subsp. sativus]
MAAQSEFRPVDPTVWRACAGNFVHVPAVGSRAYYFPQGHANAINTSASLIQSQPFVVCRVLGVDYLADMETDEILAKIQLFPVESESAESTQSESPELTQPEFASVVKVLTPSDANNGGGFSVPKSCAETVFPPLDFAADPPVQTLMVKDVLGAVWEFRHIYRGTPRRHLLTTGWSKFVNAKKLVAGDSVVFMQSKRSQQNFVGIRRAAKAKNVASTSRWNYLDLKEGEEDKSAENAVKQVMEKAVKGLGFEIVYYPKIDVSDYVVQAERVESATFGVDWMIGTRVKMAMETEDLSRMTYIQGTVSKIHQVGGVQSPWKMLQVTWDDPEVVKNVMNVSPWQVECVSLLEQSEVPAAKRSKLSVDAGSPLHREGAVIPGDGEIFEDAGLLPGRDGELFPVTRSSSSVAEPFNADLNPLLMNAGSYPGGIQGARQDHICVSGISNFFHENTHQFDITFSVCNRSPVTEAVYTEGDTVSSSSADPPKEIQFFDNEAVGTQGCSDSPKVGINSFQLFGQIIHL